MALSQSAVSELLEAFRAGQGVDLIPESVRMVLQELIETEAAEAIGAARYQRTRTRTTSGTVTATGRCRLRRGRVVADPEAAPGRVLPGDPRAAPADRPGPVRRRHGGVRARDLDPLGR
jgi:hypothetical protein